MNKKILITILSILGVTLILLLVMFTNKTYLKDIYEINATSKIKVPKYSYFVNDKDNKVTFITLKSENNIRSELADYIDDFKSCYDESYFYDEENKITIKDYNIEKGLIFNKYTISYDLKNLCEDEYVLDENWFNKFKENAVISEIEITECIVNETEKCKSKAITNTNIEEIFNYITEDSYIRIENKNNINFSNNSQDYYYINIYYGMDNMGYVLNIFKYENDLGIKIVDNNDHPKNALYELNDGININDIFKNIYNSF